MVWTSCDRTIRESVTRLHWMLTRRAKVNFLLMLEELVREWRRGSGRGQEGEEEEKQRKQKRDGKEQRKNEN